MYLLENQFFFSFQLLFMSKFDQNPMILWQIRVIQRHLRRIRPYLSQFRSTFGSLFWFNRGIWAILITFGSILSSIRITIRLYTGCPKWIRVISCRFCLIRNSFGTYSSLSQGAPRIRDE